jgi:hypothetical protein
MALDVGRDAQHLGCRERLAGQRVPGQHTATVAAADDPSPRDSGIWLCIAIRQPTPSGSLPRAFTRAASRPRTKRLSRSSVSSLRPSPSTVSSISPRLQILTSSSIRLVSARARPRQS